METRSYNGKFYQQLETYEEAESLLGKVLIGNQCNKDLKSKQLITVVRRHENGTIRANKYSLELLFNSYTFEDGSPVGKVVEEAKFKRPYLNESELAFCDRIGLSHIEAQIRRYTVQQGWIDTKPWDAETYHFGIYYDNITKMWETYETARNNTGITIDTLQHAKWLCDQLNKAKITL